jgi:KDO2-lipid IV(A) lauroyltransferase
MINGSRQTYMKHLLPSAEPKKIITALRKGDLVWYAPDQDFGFDKSIFVSFFGVETATLRATSLLVKAGRAQLIPVFFYRDSNNAYVGVVFPPIENFGEDEMQDANRYSQLLEEFVAKHPEQYLWAHRRFKTRPAGEPSLYKKR